MLETVLFYAAFGLYCVNMVVGIIAQLRLFHFGKAHHILYFVIFATAIATTVFSFHPALLLTLCALTLMPKSRPWTWQHPTSAVLGLVGYLLALASRL
jgi:hypothetical protein